MAEQRDRCCQESIALLLQTWHRTARTTKAELWMQAHFPPANSHTLQRMWMQSGNGGIKFQQRPAKKHKIDANQ